MTETGASRSPGEAAGDLIVRSLRVVTPAAMGPAAIHVRGGAIVAVAEYEDLAADLPLVDVGSAVVLPGLVDTHVHVNEPGRTEWEGFESATRAAAAGGVTTLVDMPLNSIPPTTTVGGLAAKLDAARGRCAVDVGLWGGLVPGNRSELRGLLSGGVRGFKCFLAPSGVDEFGHVSEADLRAALPLLAEAGVPLLAHAESPSVLSRAAAAAGPPGRSYAAFLQSRPPAAELESIELLVRLCREFRAPIHIVHLSTAEALPVLRRARDEGLPLTVETCPHYLHFSAEAVPDGATEYKCAPPIREAENRERLWSALGEGLIDLVASDHSPCPPPMKARESGDFGTAWGGIASLQLGLSAVWRGARERGYTALHVARWMAEAPALLAGLSDRKGSIAAGRDADLVIWDPDAAVRVRTGSLLHRHKLTPYVGETLAGAVEATYLRGIPVYRRNAPAPPGSQGRILLRTHP
jgi:allantoinase